MKGKLIVISGLSAAGKGTIAKFLVEKNENYVLSVSATTRDKRVGENEGESYFFVNTETFEKMIDRQELIEYAKYVDNYYGTPKKYVLDKINEGKNVILEIEMQGALKIKQIFSDALLIFFLPCDAKTQKERLISRGRENEKQIMERLKQAISDAEYAKYYDYVLVNDNVDNSVEDVKNIVNGTYNKNDKIKNLEILDNLVKELKEENYV